MKILPLLPKIIPKTKIGINSDWLAAFTNFPTRSYIALRYKLAGEKDTGASLLPITPVEENAEAATTAREHSSRHISFTFAAISLSALVARADGAVTREEYLAFRDAFPLTGGMCGKIRQLFLLACQSQTTPAFHAKQIKQLFPQQIELFISLVDRLFRIATADKPLSREEERLIARIAHCLGLNAAEYTMLHDRHSRPLPPHIVLGVEKRSPRNIIKKHYHALLNRYHPDRYSSIPVSPEVKMLLTLKTSEISQAYRALTRNAA